MDRGARWATVHRVAQSWTCLKGLSIMYTFFYPPTPCILTPLSTPALWLKNFSFTNDNHLIKKLSPSTNRCTSGQSCPASCGSVISAHPPQAAGLAWPPSWPGQGITRGVGVPVATLERLKAWQSLASERIPRGTCYQEAVSPVSCHGQDCAKQRTCHRRKRNYWGPLGPLDERLT